MSATSAGNKSKPRTFLPFIAAVGTLAIFSGWIYYTPPQPKAADLPGPMTAAPLDPGQTGVAGAPQAQGPARGSAGAADSGGPTASSADARDLLFTVARRDTKLPRIGCVSSQALRTVGVRIAPVVTATMEEEISAPGHVDYDQTRVAQLSPRVAGTIWRVLKHVGGHVNKGDVLAILESAEIGQAKAALLQALVQRNFKQQRVVGLKGADAAVAARSIHEAEAELHVAEIQLYNAQHALINWGLPLQLNELEGLSQAELVRHMQFLGLPADIVAELDPTNTTANLLPLKAPFEGTVIGDDLAVGELLSTNDHHLIVADTRKMWIYLDISQKDSAGLKIGQPASFKCDGLAGEVHGPLEWISTALDPKTHTMQVRIEVDNPQLRASSPPDAAENQRLLRANAVGSGKIRVRRQSQVTAVPNEAVQTTGATLIVFVRIDDATFEARPVQTGSVLGSMTEVIDGLRVGDEVATAGSQRLKAELMRQAASRQRSLSATLAAFLASAANNWRLDGSAQLTNSAHSRRIYSGP